MIAFLRTSPAPPAGASKRTRDKRPPVIRTNNQVERTHRQLRFFEKTRYKWRRRRNIVRFVLLAFTRWRDAHPTATAPPHTNPPPDSRNPVGFSAECRCFGPYPYQGAVRTSGLLADCS